MPINYGSNDVSTSGNIFATSGAFTSGVSVNNNTIWHSGNTHANTHSQGGSDPLIIKLEQVTDFSGLILGGDGTPVNSFLSNLANGNSWQDAFESVGGTLRIGSYSGLFVKTGTDGFLEAISGITTNDITNFNSSVSGLVNGFYQPLLNNPTTGTGTSGYLSKWISNSGINNASIYDNGSNVGIGTNSPSYKLHTVTTAGDSAIYSSNTQTNTSIFSLMSSAHLNTTQNGTINVRGIQSEVKNVISAGITNSGNMIGLNTLSLRNFLTSNDAGTLSNLYGININYGHGIQQALNPTTNNAYGILVSPFRGSGTIDNAYDIYLAPDVHATGTMTKHYGIYQAQNNWNYFAGNVGIGVVQPSGINALQVNGTARVDSTVLVVGDGSTASVSCTNYTANAQGPQLFLRKSRGSESSGSVVNTNDVLGNINFQGRNTNNLHVSAARIRGLCEVTPTGDNVAGQLVFGVGTATTAVADKMWLYSTGALDVDGNTFRLRSSRTISSSSSTGSTGEVCWDSNYLYVCIATNTWRRISLGASF